MNITIWIDSALALVLSLLFPLYAWLAYRGFREAVRIRGSAARIREYRLTIAIQWILVLVTILVWFLPGRGAEQLGLQAPLGWRSWAGLGVTAAGLAFLTYQWFGIRALDAEGQRKLHAQLDTVRDLLPRTEREYRLFQLLSLTAGICEEILYRGFLIAYATQFMPEWLAVLSAGVIFGAAHFYQGILGCVKTGVMGIVAGGLYVGTDSLLWPMVLHTAIDLHGGAVGRFLLQAKSSGRDTIERGPVVSESLGTSLNEHD